MIYSTIIGLALIIKHTESAAGITYLCPDVLSCLESLGITPQEQIQDNQHRRLNVESTPIELYNQFGSITSGYSSEIIVEGVFSEIADDFIIPLSESWTITQFTAPYFSEEHFDGLPWTIGETVVDEFVINIYNDDNTIYSGGPGSIICSQTRSVGNNQVFDGDIFGPVFGRGLYLREIIIDIDPIILESGHYWISAKANTGGGATQFFQAAQSTIYNDQFFRFLDPNAFGANGCSMGLTPSTNCDTDPSDPIFSLKGYTVDSTWKQWEVMGYFKVGCPCGMISMWYGDPYTIPSGYTLCDGDLGTPDLRDKFIVGAGGDFALDDTGGGDSITIAVENLPAHSHPITAQPTDVDPVGHGHTFELGAVNDANAAHSHVIAPQTSDAEADHDHELGDALINLTDEPDHSHGIPAASTGTDGNHAHVMQAFADHDTPPMKVTGIKAEQILDGSQPLQGMEIPIDSILVDTTQIDGAHSHTIPSDTSGDGGSHSHGIAGGATELGGGHDHTISSHNTNNDGGHTHGVSGSIGPDVHGHTVSGVTDDTGDGDDIDYLPPYGAVYFICCIREPGSW